MKNEKAEDSRDNVREEKHALKYHYCPTPPLLGKAVEECNMCACSGNSTQERAVQDLLCLV